MTFIVTEECVNCKHTDCVNVCPVDCFYEGPNFLVINPDECIDCGVCVPECPVDAICSDRDTREDIPIWLEINKTYSQTWPNIVNAKPALPDHETWRGCPNKIELIEDWPNDNNS